MAVRKICKPKGCRGSPRCSHPWWFDVMCRGKRSRMRVDDFAIARGAKEPIASKQTAERVWEPKFVAEIMTGRGPAHRSRRATGGRAADGRRLPRPLLQGLRRSGGASGSDHHQRTARRSQGSAWQPGGGHSREGERDPAIQGGVSARTRGRDRQPCPQHAARRDQLGTVPGSAVPGCCSPTDTIASEQRMVRAWTGRS